MEEKKIKRANVLSDPNKRYLHLNVVVYVNKLHVYVNTLLGFNDQSK